MRKLVNHNVTCPKGHKRVWKRGKVPTRGGAKQRYICVTCGRTFYRGG